jgi:Fuc2NAc and GlcNAc transferase
MGQVVAWGWIGIIILLVSMVWLINVFNFMDGIDGIAGSMAVFAACAGGALAWAAGNTPTTMIAFMLAGSVSGFLIWNWPPARIFMGDVGSGFLGFVLGTLIILNMQHNSSNAWVWVILLGVFLADSTTTLIRRIALGKRWWQAHRSHAYQHLARRWGSHRKVVLLALCTDIFWLLPLAILAWMVPFFAMPLALAANVPLLFGCIKAKAGLGE